MQATRTIQWGNTTLIPQVYGGWAHEYLLDDSLVAQFVGGETPFSIDRGGVFRDAGIVSAGLTAVRNKHTSLFTRYEGEFSSGGHFNAVELGLTHQF